MHYYSAIIWYLALVVALNTFAIVRQQFTGRCLSLNWVLRVALAVLLRGPRLVSASRDSAAQLSAPRGGELHSNEDVSSGWSRVLLSAAAQLCLEKFQLKCPRNSFEKEIEILFFYGSLSRHAKFQRQINETQNHFSYCAIHCCSRLRISVAAFWLNKPLFTKSFVHFFSFPLILIKLEIRLLKYLMMLLIAIDCIFKLLLHLSCGAR